MVYIFTKLESSCWLGVPFNDSLHYGEKSVDILLWFFGMGDKYPSWKLACSWWAWSFFPLDSALNLSHQSPCAWLNFSSGPSFPGVMQLLLPKLSGELWLFLWTGDKQTSLGTPAEMLLWVTASALYYSSIPPCDPSLSSWCLSTVGLGRKML